MELASEPLSSIPVLGVRPRNPFPIDPRARPSRDLRGSLRRFCKADEVGMSRASNLDRITATIKSRDLDLRRLTIFKNQKVGADIGQVTPGSHLHSEADRNFHSREYCKGPKGGYGTKSSKWGYGGRHASPCECRCAAQPIFLAGAC